MQHDNVSQDVERRKGRFLRSMTRSVGKLIGELEADPEAPPAMSYFFSVMRNAFLPQTGTPDGAEPSSPLFEGQKTIGTYCIMAPEEFIYAAGAVPIRLCGGSYEATLAGDEFVPRDICPVVRASAGFTAFGLLPAYRQCDVVVVPTTCDGKRKLGEVLSQYKPVWMLEVPHVKDNERARLEWTDQIFALKRKIEKLTRKKITRKSLYQAIQRIGRAQYQARRLHEFRAAFPSVVFGRHAMLALNAYAFDTVDRWTDAMARLNDDLQVRLQAGESVAREGAPRILLAGSPIAFPNWKLPMLIEEMGGVVAIDETCLADRFLYDPVGISEGSMTEMVRAIAARLIMPCTCPSFSPNEDRLFRLKQLVQKFRIDGVVYHVLKSCMIYDFEVARVEKIMRDMGIPLIRVETDYNPEDVEQLRTRIEAFIEMTGSRKSEVKRDAVEVFCGD